MIQNSQVAALAARVQQYSAEPRKQFVAPSAEASRYAAYLDAWRTRVEAVGTQHYPDEARGRIYGSLRLTVSVRADGSIADVEIDEPSPHAVLNQAARHRAAGRAVPALPARDRARHRRAGHHAQLALRQRHPGNPSPMTEARYAVIGNPIAHSRSPQIHAMFARQTGRALRYDRLLAPLDGFVAATAAFVAEGGLGLNVTVPFKQEACALAAGNLSDRARLAGAVNTLSWRNGAWHGCNTDGVGLVSDLLRLGLRLDGARVLLVGAGGAARGVLQPLAQAGCARIHIVNRTAARALELAEAWRASEAGLPVQVTAGTLAEAATPGGWDAVINATASGLADAAPTCPAACMPRRAGLRHDVRRRTHRLHEAGRGRRRRAHGGRPGHAGGPGGRELPYLARPAARSRARAGGAARRSGGGTLKAWRAAPARAAGPGSGSSPA